MQKFKLLILVPLFFLIGCDSVNKDLAEIRLQKLYPNCQVFEVKTYDESPRVKHYIVKTTDNKIFHIHFIGSGMEDPNECFPPKFVENK